MSDSKTFLKEMFIDQVKPALDRCSGGGALIAENNIPEITEDTEV